MPVSSICSATAGLSGQRRARRQRRRTPCPRNDHDAAPVCVIAPHVEQPSCPSPAADDGGGRWRRPAPGLQRPDDRQLKRTRGVEGGPLVDADLLEALDEAPDDRQTVCERSPWRAMSGLTKIADGQRRVGLGQAQRSSRSNCRSAAPA